MFARLFSSHEYSITTSFAGFRRHVRTFIQSRLYAFGSCTVTVCSIVFESFRRSVFVITICLLCGWPLVSSFVYPLKPFVTMTSVSPSQCPVDRPVHDSGKSSGHLNLSFVGTQWNHVFCSNRNASASGLWRICTPCGELMLRDMPNGRQLPV